MRHAVDGRKFGRNTSHRKAMFKNMANSVITHEQVVTTLQKAKEIRRVVDRLITLGKSGTPASRRLAFGRTRDELVVKKLFADLATRYKTRDGGYTRVLKLSDRRWGDAAEMAVIQLVDAVIIDKKKKPKTVNADGTTSGQAQAPADPFARFRKMFGKQVKKTEAGGDQAAPKEKKAKAPKAAKVASVAKAKPKADKPAKKTTKKDA